MNVLNYAISFLKKRKEKRKEKKKALSNASQPEVRKESGTGNLIINTRPEANFSPTLLKSYGGKGVTEQIKAKWGL